MDGYLEKTEFGTDYSEEHSFEIKLINSTNNAKLLNYSRIDPSTYSALVDSTTSFLLSLDTVYDPSWIAYANGHEYKPISSDDSINVFYINETGFNEIKIEYVPQKWFYIGGIISILGILLSIIYVMRFEK